jgi:hypothetical protein
MNRRLIWAFLIGSCLALSTVIAAAPMTSDAAYNLGTSSIREGKVGAGIWALETARALSPRDSDIAYNLTAARQRVRAPIPPGMPVWDAILDGLRWVSPIEALGVWMGVTTLLCSLIFAWLGLEKSVRGWVLQTTTIFWLILSIPVGIRVWDARSPRGVVMASVLKVRISPDQDAVSVADAPAGTVVRLVEFRPGWIQIQLPDGTLGWGALGAIQKI